MDNLTVDIAKIGVYIPEHNRVMVRSRFGKVIMFIDDAHVELTTTIAHNVGMTIMKAIGTLEKDELFDIRINGKSLKLLAPVAKKVSTALLRKADDADDWQINNNRRVLQ